jgi:hypothetical protein
MHGLVLFGGAFAIIYGARCLYDMAKGRNRVHPGSGGGGFSRAKPRKPSNGTSGRGGGLYDADDLTPTQARPAQDSPAAVK